MATPNRSIQTSIYGRYVGLAADGTLIVHGQVDHATLTPAAGAANVCTVTIQCVDNDGGAVAVATLLDVWVSDAATGIGLTANANTSEVTASTGALMGIATTEKAWLIQTDATGKAVLSITDTGKHATFAACLTPHRANISVAASACVYG